MWSIPIPPSVTESPSPSHSSYLLNCIKAVQIWRCNKIDLEFFVHGLLHFPWVGQTSTEKMSRKGSFVEQDDCSSCSSFPPLESSNEYYEIVTIGSECVPGLEGNDEWNMFLVECLLSSMYQTGCRTCQTRTGEWGSSWTWSPASSGYCGIGSKGLVYMNIG